MSFTNSEQLYGVLSKVIANSGGGGLSGFNTGATGVLDGAGVLFSVTSSIASGVSISGASFSGAILAIYNARSGITKPDTSGGGWLYYWLAGGASGAAGGTGGTTVLPPDQWSPQPFTSGLNVAISGTNVLALTVTYRAGI